MTTNLKVEDTQELLDSLDRILGNDEEIKLARARFLIGALHAMILNSPQEGSHLYTFPKVAQMTEGPV